MKSYPEDIHWWIIVRNLRMAGLSYQEMANETGFTVHELVQMESEVLYPPYLSIIKLLDLHLLRCPSRHRSIGIMNPEEAE
jgi:hypothetical protein